MEFTPIIQVDAVRRMLGSNFTSVDWIQKCFVLIVTTKDPLLSWRDLTVSDIKIMDASQFPKVQAQLKIHYNHHLVQSATEKIFNVAICVLYEVSGMYHFEVHDLDEESCYKLKHKFADQALDWVKETVTAKQAAAR